MSIRCSDRDVDPRSEDVFPDADDESRSILYELGKRLEECVAKILEARGYKVKLREKVRGVSGVEHEIDIVARKGSSIKAVECKNWKVPVGKEETQKFHDTLKDLGRSWSGIFVSYAGFTEDAEMLAECYGIELWDSDFLKEDYWIISVGRVGHVVAERSIVVENALPINVDFSKATELKLKNKEKVAAYGTLSYHPYYIISYPFHARVKDPTKRTHKFADEGKVFIDGLDGSVLNPPSSTISMTLKAAFSKEEKKESWRRKLLIQELESGAAVKEYEVKAGESYKVMVLQPLIILH